VTDSEAEPRRRPGGRSARVGAAVIDATLTLLAEGGFDAVGIDEVATTAGVHKTTVYRRWGTRERLVAEALARRSADEVPVPDSGTLRRDLDLVARSVAANLSDPLGNALATAMVGHAADPEIARITDEFWSTRFERMSVVVERGVERGEADPGGDAALVIEVVVAAVWFRCVVARSEVDDDLVAAAVDAAMTLVAPGPASPAR